MPTFNLRNMILRQANADPASQGTGNLDVMGNRLAPPPATARPGDQFTAMGIDPQALADLLQKDQGLREELQRRTHTGDAQPGQPAPTPAPVPGAAPGGTSGLETLPWNQGGEETATGLETLPWNQEQGAAGPTASPGAVLGPPPSSGASAADPSASRVNLRNAYLDAMAMNMSDPYRGALLTPQERFRATKQTGDSLRRYKGVMKNVYGIDTRSMGRGG